MRVHGLFADIRKQTLVKVTAHRCAGRLCTENGRGPVPAPPTAAAPQRNNAGGASGPSGGTEEAEAYGSSIWAISHRSGVSVVTIQHHHIILLTFNVATSLFLMTVIVYHLT